MSRTSCGISRRVVWTFDGIHGLFVLCHWRHIKAIRQRQWVIKFSPPSEAHKGRDSIGLAMKASTSGHDISCRASGLDPCLEQRCPNPHAISVADQAQSRLVGPWSASSGSNLIDSVGIGPSSAPIFPKQMLLTNDARARLGPEQGNKHTRLSWRQTIDEVKVCAMAPWHDFKATSEDQGLDGKAAWCIFMDSRDASISRSLCQHCNRPESSKGEFSYYEGGCVSWVDNGTHTKWPIFVDNQLGSPPLVVNGGKNNKCPILLSDDKEFDKTLKLIEGTSFKFFVILRM
ncbi:hypothetical protein H5410_003969 [Solanum commersonii]|uniref:Uncharacterized protein n=1 Tax=Solanum commersonii TaxID=4109 RepID=A0A9J6B6Q8_SOLCO|nr:hypothetical protein H5410_003969 [Solanum commersonii]